jgi:HSP20 family protein
MATLVRWEPFREFAALQSEMGRLMNTLFEGQANGNFTNGNGRAQSWVPAVDVWETENELVYAFDLPGIPEDKISVELQDGTLTVSAEREKAVEQTGERYFRFERRHGSFARAIPVPQGVSDDGITASYTNGVLEVHVPKPEQQKPKRIQIGSGAQATIEGETS